MVAALALLFAHQAAAITFESTAITVQGFCKELSKQTGKKYVAWDEVQGDLIAVHLDAAPVDEVLKHLEYVERAKLDFDGITNNLRPDYAVRTKLKADWMTDRVKAIKGVQDHLRTLVREKPLDDAQSKEIATTISHLHAKEDAQYEAQNFTALNQTNQQIQDQELRLPAGNVMLRLFLAIPPEELAAIPIDEVGVWSTSPTQVELPCHLAPSSALRELASEQSVWSEASAKYLADDTSYLANLTPTNSILTAVLRLEVLPDFLALDELTLTGFDADGKRSFEMMQSLNGDETLPLAAPAALSRDQNPVTISIPTDTQRLLQLWGGYPPESEMATWADDRALKEIYFNPEKYDPVGETFGRVMIEVSKARKEQLIAAEPDDFAHWFPVDTIVRGKLTDRALEAAFFDNGAKYRTVQYANDDSWMTARPGLIGVKREWEFSRSALGKLLRTARDNQAVTLMDAARFVAGTDDRVGLVSPLRLLPIFAPDVSGLALLKGGGWQLKAFLGRLDEAQIAAAQQPGGLALSGCTPFQLKSLAYRFQSKRFIYRGDTGVWRSYPTDGLPTGLPGGGVLHLSVDPGAALRARFKRDGGYALDAYGSVSQIAAHLSDAAAPDSTLHLVGLVPQVSQSYVFNFEFPNDVSTTEKLNDYRPSGKEVKTVEELDEPLRSQLQAALDKASRKKCRNLDAGGAYVNM